MWNKYVYFSFKKYILFLNMAKSIYKLRKPPTFSLGSKCKFINKKHIESTRNQYYA